MMSVYKISATKYRPNTFMDVVGQDAVTSTLQNAIKQNKLGQALLFCGPRGVGKTTCARILAKKINLNEGKNIDDFSFNIFELDAASNRSVDDIRSLNEQVRVPPRIGNFKVYIIDEVHMLTTEAFNAFLKTLEEPPEHVIFILATTEKSKILPTILSRCQIYDFRRISVLDIKKRIEAILIEEKIKFDDESLYLIAECSDGSLRDGLQILDRLINFCENDISIKKVSKNLNIIGPEQYIQICDYIIKKNISEALVKFDKIISNGFSEINFIIGLSNHFRNLFLSKNNNTINLLETSEKLKSFHLEQSKKVNLDWIRKALKITNSFEINFKNVDNKRIHTELCLMQVASIEIEEKNISEKKNIYINDDKPIIIEKNKNNDINKKVLENSIPKVISTSEDINEDNSKKKTTNLNIGVKEISSFSLSSVEKKRTFKSRMVNNDISKSKILGNESNFTQGDLEKCWNIYYNIKIQNKEFNMASLLKLNKPIKNNNDIKYTVMSDINKKELEDELPKLLKYIRNSLKNDFIEVKIDSNNSIKKNVLFTPSEKFEKLIELNPLLEILRKKLDLDY
ncbi:MAG: DNA polymerase III subunit gamma/tau [Flavobacteriaceae bacterium]|tara:strand:- start:576 stop:2285 length:1710 start_codon:yes stop_codon:yes gene_type:complete